MIEKILALLRACFLFLPVVDQPELCGIDGAPGINGPVGVTRAARAATRYIGEGVLTAKYGLGRVTEIGPPDRTGITSEPEWIGVTPLVAGYQMKFAPGNVQDAPPTADDNVLSKARILVALPPPEYGYSDVGDVLVSYLRGDATTEQALDTLDGYAIDFACARARSKT